MISKKYIAYYRVSTQRQGKSGLGLAAQREYVRNFLRDDNPLVNDYQDIETGKNSNRPELLKAIEECKKTGATLLIAKLDRLSRNAKFILTLRDSKVDFICADMPDANSLTIGMMAIIAQDEVERISKRVKDALGVIKDKLDRGETHVSKNGNVINKLGSGTGISEEIRNKGLQVRQNNAKNNPESKKAGALIVSLKESGKSFYAITKILNQSGFKAPKGGEFSQAQTKRLYERYC
jgi:DNA invertase Pin-like site-specific DNA recombinase